MSSVVVGLTVLRRNNTNQMFFLKEITNIRAGFLSETAKKVLTKKLIGEIGDI